MSFRYMHTWIMQYWLFASLTSILPYSINISVYWAEVYSSPTHNLFGLGLALPPGLGADHVTQSKENQYIERIECGHQS